MRCYHIRLQPVKSCLLLLHAYLRRVGLLRGDGTSRSRASIRNALASRSSIITVGLT